MHSERNPGASEEACESSTHLLEGERAPTARRRPALQSSCMTKSQGVRARRGQSYMWETQENRPPAHPSVRRGLPFCLRASFSSLRTCEQRASEEERRTS